MKCIFLFFAFFVITQQIFAQAIIYKKNGEEISVYNLDVAGKNRSYQLPGDAEGVRRYLSISAIDSIRYEDGSKDVFPSFTYKENTPEEEKESINRFLLGADLASLAFYDNIKISLEYLPGNGFVGLSFAYSINSDPLHLVYYGEPQYYSIYANLVKLLNWNGRAGINYYIFPPGSFRISSGLNWITGKYTEELVKNLDEEPWTSILSIKDKSLNGLLLSPGLHWQPKRFLRITAAVDIGIYMKPNVTNNLVMRTELMFNF